MIERAEIGRQIEARERVARIHDAMAAAGTMGKDDRRRHMNALDRAASVIPAATRSRVERPPLRVPGAPLSPADAAIRSEGRSILAGLGIPVVKAGSDG